MSDVRGYPKLRRERLQAREDQAREAREAAARLLNKFRRGRMPRYYGENVDAAGQHLTRADLLELALHVGVPNAGRMTKMELAHALQAASPTRTWFLPGVFGRDAKNDGSQSSSVARAGTLMESFSRGKIPTRSQVRAAVDGLSHAQLVALAEHASVPNPEHLTREQLSAVVVAESRDPWIAVRLARWATGYRVVDDGKNAPHVARAKDLMRELRQGYLPAKFSADVRKAAAGLRRDDLLELCEFASVRGAGDMTRKQMLHELDRPAPRDRLRRLALAAASVKRHAVGGAVAAGTAAVFPKFASAVLRRDPAALAVVAAAGLGLGVSMARGVARAFRTPPQHDRLYGR